MAASLAAKQAVAASTAEAARCRAALARETAVQAELITEMAECNREIRECIEELGGDEFVSMCATVASVMRGNELVCNS